MSTQPVPCIGRHAKYDTPSIIVPATGTGETVTLLSVTLDQPGTWAVQAKTNVDSGSEAATTGEVVCTLVVTSAGSPPQLLDEVRTLYEGGAVSATLALQGVASVAETAPPSVVQLTCSNFILDVAGASVGCNYVRITAVQIA